MSIQKFMEGRKTYTSLIISFIGVFGVAEYISPSEATILIDHIFELVGLVGAVYGRTVSK